MHLLEHDLIAALLRVAHEPDLSKGALPNGLELRVRAYGALRTTTFTLWCG